MNLFAYIYNFFYHREPDQNPVNNTLTLAAGAREDFESLQINLYKSVSFLRFFDIRKSRYCSVYFRRDVSPYSKTHM